MVCSANSVVAAAAFRFYNGRPTDRVACAYESRVYPHEPLSLPEQRGGSQTMAKSRSEENPTIRKSSDGISHMRED